MRYFQVNVRREPTEYGFMPTMELYLLEEGEKKRPMVLIVPGGGYTKVCVVADGEKTAMQYNAAGAPAGSDVSYPHIERKRGQLGDS